MSTAAQKAGLREQLRATGKTISQEERAAASAELCARLPQETIWREAKSVLLFTPLPDEPDIRPLFEAAWASGKAAAFLRFDAASGSYLACRVRKPDELQPGKFGVLEPGPDCPVLELNQLDFLLVPGVAFDLVGRRLGRGKGYYDRLLAGVPGHKCGAAFAWQLVATVPAEPHDVRLNSLLTPSRWLRCQGAV
jgi:5-formyltetrahydrofolate cyclo-ligase